MFIVNLTYKVSLDQVDQHLAAHVAYLDRQYAAGNFLASGRKNPRNGGIILTKLTNKETLLGLLAQDPFEQHDLADYEILEFIPSKTCEEMAFLLEI
ncbi:MAG: YciI family protein [Saprospiraceae bacterium]